jgi:hypothetical protein
MVNFTNFTRTAAAAVSALVVSMAFITAAVGPAATAASGRTDSYAAAVQGPVMVQEKQA